MRNLKAFIKRKLTKFPGSEAYWENRYKEGGNSGSGSYGRLAAYKAKFLNEFISLNNIQSLVDLGCGDGNQLQQLNFPSQFTYHGVDVSEEAVNICKKKFNQKDFSFSKYQEYSISNNTYDIALSMDVLFHIIDEKKLHQYLEVLFSSANKFVIIYSSNQEYENRAHVRDRNFTSIVEKRIPSWKLILEEKPPFTFDENNPDQTTRSHFFVYEKRAL